VRVWPGCRRAN